LCTHGTAVTIPMIEDLIKKTGQKIPKHFRKKMQNLMHKIDPKNDGTIDFYYFCEIVHSYECVRVRNEELKDAFRALDLNKDGTLSIKEL
jgi:Ca2+-binding EF-hand superfamily protein